MIVNVEPSAQLQYALYDEGPSEVLRDIVAAVARADDENILASPGLAVTVSAGVQNLAAEVSQARNVGKARNTTRAGRQHDVARAHLPLRAVGPAQHDGPSFRIFVVGAAFEFGGRPVVQLHTFYIGFEPRGQLVLGNVGRPVRRERH